MFVFTWTGSEGTALPTVWAKGHPQGCEALQYIDQREGPGEDLWLWNQWLLGGLCGQNNRCWLQTVHGSKSLYLSVISYEMQTVHSSMHFKIKLKPQIYTIFAKFVLQNLQKIKLYFIVLFRFFLYMLGKFITSYKFTSNKYGKTSYNI